MVVCICRYSMQHVPTSGQDDPQYMFLNIATVLNWVCNTESSHITAFSSNLWWSLEILIPWLPSSWWCLKSNLNAHKVTKPGEKHRLKDKLRVEKSSHSL